MRIVHEAGKVDLLDNIDRAFLAIYADNYDRYTKASAALQEDGLTVATEYGEIPSPYLKIASDAATQIHRCSTKLGLRRPTGSSSSFRRRRMISRKTNS